MAGRLSGASCYNEFRVLYDPITTGNTGHTFVGSSGDKRRASRLKKIDGMTFPGNTGAIPPLLKALTDADDEIRSAAADALGKIGDPKVVPQVLPLLHDRYPKARWAAAHALGWLGDKSIVPHLVEALFDPVDDVSLVAMMSLQWLGGGDAVPALLKLVAVENRSIRQAARGTILSLGDAAIPPLIAILHSGDRGTRRSAADMLAQFGEPAVTALLAALDTFDSDGRQVVIRTLGDMGEAATEGLLVSLRDPDDASRRTAARSALVKMGTLSVLALIDVLITSPPPVQQDAAWALAAIGEEAVPPLLRALQGRDDAARTAILQTIHHIGDAAVMQLLALLFDEALDLRLAAAWALGRIGAPNAVLGLLRALKDGEDLMRWAAARALGEIGDEAASRPLLRALEDPNGAVRIEAASSLARMGVIAGLIAAFRSPREEARWAAGIGLSALAETRAADFLNQWRAAAETRTPIARVLQEVVTLELAPDLPTLIFREIEDVLDVRIDQSSSFSAGAVG
jgi:HEAT repeat protein